MAWNMSQAGLYKDHHSPSHEGGPGDSCNLQLFPLAEPFHKIVGAEALDRNVHLAGHPLTRFIVGVNKSLVHKSVHQFNEEAPAKYFRKPTMNGFNSEPLL